MDEKSDESQLLHPSPARMYVQDNVQPLSQQRSGWVAAPLSFKLYRNGERIQFTDDSASEQVEKTDTCLTQRQLGQMLAHIYGLTRQCWRYREDIMPQPTTPSILENVDKSRTPFNNSFFSTFLRPVPSGGALFPCELYLLVASAQEVSAGIYHYDVGHHALDILRIGDYMPLLVHALAHPGERLPQYTLLLSSAFWKDGFKYGTFSYRLQGLDIGTIIAQCMLVSRQYDVQATVHYQFLDRDIDSLLGLDLLTESIYAVITLESLLEACTIYTPESTMKLPVEAPLLAQTSALEPISRWSLAEAVHQASLIATSDVFQPLRRLRAIVPLEGIRRKSFSHPDIMLDLLAKLYNRHSGINHCLHEPLTHDQFIHLLNAAIRNYRNDLDGDTPSLQHTLLYVIVNAIQDTPAGIYCYHSLEQALELIHVSDMRSEMQKMYTRQHFNMSQVSVCIIPVGQYESGFEVYGDRWYRMQNMEAGMVVQHLYLAAATLGLGCHANLEYANLEMDALLQLPVGYHSLIQVLIGSGGKHYKQYEQAVLPY